MTVSVTIIVTDAPPLITLATARSLDYLLYPALPIIIPDAVFYEATSATGKLGAQAILDWYHEHRDKVRVEPTEAFQDALTLAALRGGRLARNTGEKAAVEVVRKYPLLPAERALLLTDDKDVERITIGNPAQLILMTTWDYLCQLEEAERIPSAAAVFELVYKAGRNPPKSEPWGRHDPEIREAVRAVMEQAQERVE